MPYYWARNRHKTIIKKTLVTHTVFLADLNLEDIWRTLPHLQKTSGPNAMEKWSLRIRVHCSTSVDRYLNTEMRWLILIPFRVWDISILIHSVMNQSPSHDLTLKPHASHSSEPWKKHQRIQTLHSHVLTVAMTKSHGVRPRPKLAYLGSNCRSSIRQGVGLRFQAILLRGSPAMCFLIRITNVEQGEAKRSALGDGLLQNHNAPGAKKT